MTTRIEMDLEAFSFEKAEFVMGRWQLTFDDRKRGIHLDLRLGNVPASESEKQENFEELGHLIRTLQSEESEAVKKGGADAQET